MKKVIGISFSTAVLAGLFLISNQAKAIEDEEHFAPDNKLHTYSSFNLDDHIIHRCANDAKDCTITKK
ncbi:MAG: hypothetical protein AAFQ94_29330 [Bacteroidota bacterium]